MIIVVAGYDHMPPRSLTEIGLKYLSGPSAEPSLSYPFWAVRYIG
jgi:hypothetical protein